VAAYNTADNAYMHFYCSSITIEGGADLAEPFKITSGEIEVPQGAVVVIDDQNPGHLKVSNQAYDTRVAGVVSGANGIQPGIQMQQQGMLDGGKNVALTGRVYVQADAANGAINPGDLLTTSSTPGHAMKVTNHTQAQGAILGKAMTGLSKGRGLVLVLVTLQ
jgi:UDP-N-acetylmuramyl tripeptide synthase